MCLSILVGSRSLACNWPPVDESIGLVDFLVVRHIISKKVMVMPTMMITVSVTATPTTAASDEENPLIIEGLDAVASEFEVEVVMMLCVTGVGLQSWISVVLVVGCVHIVVYI